MRSRRHAPAASEPRAHGARPLTADAAARPTTPSLRVFVPLCGLLVVALLYATTHTNALVDTWTSLAAGRYIAAHGVGDTDPFSFNSRPPATAGLASGASSATRLWAWLHPSGWINQAWLSHLALFSLYRLGGAGALLAWKLLLYALVSVAMVGASRARGARAEIAVIVAAATLLVLRGYAEIRGQDVTNLAVAALMVVLAVAGRGRRRALWALPPLFALWANAHGGFVYGLLALATVIAAGWVAARFPGWARQSPDAARRTLVFAAAAAVAVTVVASPYRLANLTHPLAVSVGTDAALWRTIREWHPLWRADATVVLPFLAFAAATVVAGAAAAARAQARPTRRPGGEPFDLAGAALVVLGTALAIASVRFIPVACLTAAPILAQWTEQAVAARSRGRNALATVMVRRPWSSVAVAACWLAFVVAASVFALRFQRTYLAPWPADVERTGMLDRMDGAHAFATGVCAFLAANHVSGRIWEFWEDAGYLSWCQPPDPATGRPPVQVFIDGRAQQAYPAAVYRSYLQVKAAGPAGERAAARGGGLTAEEAGEAAGWVGTELARSGIWLADIPTSRQREYFSLALLNLPSWQPVYLDEERTLLADVDTPQGRALSDGIESGATALPDPSSRALTLARRAVARDGDNALREVVAQARRANAERPSARAARLAAQALPAPAAHADAAAFLGEVADDFAANRGRYRLQNGFLLRVLAAETAVEALRRDAEQRAQGDVARTLAGRLADLRSERERVAAQVLW